MNFPKHYAVGTASVTEGSRAVTGVATFWLSNVRAGDIFWLAGIACRISSSPDDSNTSLTLAHPWPGATASGAAYEVWWSMDEIGYQHRVRELIDSISDGNLGALDALSGAANRLPYFSGAGQMDLATLTPAMRAVLGLAGSPGARIPVVTNTGAAALRNIVGTASQSGGTPTGAIIEHGSNSNGRYTRFADGTQICIGARAGAGQMGQDAIWVFPSAFLTGIPMGFSIVPFDSNANFARLAYAVGYTATELSFRAFAIPISGGALGLSTVNHRILAVGRWY